MRADTTTVTSPHDGLAIFVRTWLPDGEAKGVVQLAHGMAEHSARYARFAQALTDAGYNGPVCVEVEDEAFHDTLEGRKRSLRISHGVLQPLIA